MSKRIFSLIATAALLVSGCSDSDSPSSVIEPELINVVNNPTAVSDNQSETTTGPGENTTPATVPTNNASSEPTITSTQVTFDITVPVYVSNALQVNVVWGDENTNASWVMDESWTATLDVPTNTTNELIVTFNDDDGGTTLGSFEQTFTTGTNSAETFQISAEQFDTDRWDSNGDGVSNLDERLAGTNSAQPVVGNTDNDGAPPPVDTTIELFADKTVRIQWQTLPTADYYRILENVDGNSGYEPISDELGAAVDSFDHRVALHRRVNARYIVEACNTSGCSSSVQQLIESLDGQMEQGVGYFKSDNPAELYNFGSAISLSADGQTLAVGENIGDGTFRSNPTNAGAVYVFQRSNGQWEMQQRLFASNGDLGDAFGSSLELSSDGNTLVVGAPGEASTTTGVNGNEADNSTDDSGAAYVFVHSGTRWDQQAYIKASNTPTAEVPSIGDDDRFGIAVSISADGRTIVVGATGEDSGATGINGNESDNSGVHNGAAYLFIVENGVWSQQAYIKPSASNGIESFGQSVSLSADGNTLAVSGYDSFTPASTTVTPRGGDIWDVYGAVYLFTRSNSSWQQQALLRPSENESDWWKFGAHVDLSDDGNTLVAFGRGGVYVLERQGSNWQTQLLVPSNPESGSSSKFTLGFGDGLSISGDGSTVAIGWPEESSASTGLQGYQGAELGIETSGATYVFENEAGNWQQSAYIKAPNSRESLWFGTSISLDKSGDTLAISAENESSNGSGVQGNQADSSMFGAGAVYLY